MKPKRKKIHREWLENQLAKYERRIQKLAEGAYHIRQAIEMMDRQEAARNESKNTDNKDIVEAAIQTKVEEKDYAICGNATGERLGSASDLTGETGGLVCPSIQTDGGEMDSQPELDNVEPNP